MSKYAISFQGWRCPDGAEIIEPVESDYARTLLGQNERGISYRTTRREPVPLTADGTGHALVLKYVAAVDERLMLAFVSEFGLPDPGEGGFQPMTTLEGDRRYLASLIEMFETDGPKAVEHFEGFAALRMNSIRPSLYLPAGETKPALALIPQSLLGYMVLEVGLIVSGHTQLLKCAHCGTPFLGGLYRGKRLSAMYCSNRCRVAAQRARKSQMVAEAVDPS